MNLVKSSQLGFLACDSGHPVMQIYPLDIDLAQKGDFVAENGEVQAREEWLKVLEQEWTCD